MGRPRGQFLECSLQASTGHHCNHQLRPDRLVLVVKMILVHADPVWSHRLTYCRNNYNYGMRENCIASPLYLSLSFDVN